MNMMMMIMMISDYVSDYVLSLHYIAVTMMLCLMIPECVKRDCAGSGKRLYWLH